MFNPKIIYLLDGDQTGRATAAKLRKWAGRAIEPTGTLAYVGADELIVYVGPHSRSKTFRVRANLRQPLAELTLGMFPDTLDVQTDVLGSRRLLHITVTSGSQVTDMALAFVAGSICSFCPNDAIFRIVSTDSHARNLCKFLEEMDFSCQIIAP